MGSPRLPIFGFDDYKKFLRAWFDQNSELIKGVRSRFAEAIGCNTAYISHVMNGSAHLSSEQALAAAEYIGLREGESRYLVALVCKSRAGTKKLAAFYDQEIQELKSAQRNIKVRIGPSRSLSPEQEKTYYSNWVYTAAHMALFIPSHQNPKVLAMSLGISPATALETIDFLVKAGLAESAGGGRYRGLISNHHLEKSSPLVLQHHTNWRIKNLSTFHEQKASDLHYTSVICVSEEDKDKVQEAMLQAIENIRKIVRESKPDEQVLCYTLDLTQVSKIVD